MHGELEKHVKLTSQQRAGFISDLHIGPDDPDIEPRFRSYLEQSLGHLDVLFILGDLFEFWIGDDAADLCGYSSAVGTLADFATRSRCRLYFMHGNRDFLIGSGFARETGCHLLADPCVLEYSGTRILLSHGDAYCTDDTEHQSFRDMVRNPGWQREFLRQSRHDRLDFARNARQQSEYGKSLKSSAIMDVNEGAIEKAMKAARVRFMIHGHTHRADIHSVSVEGAPGYRIVLGDWFTGSSSLTIEAGAIHYAPSGVASVLDL